MRRRHLLIILLLFLGFGLRVWTLANQSFWWDEAFTWQITSHGLANFWYMLLTGDRNPPVYFANVALWGGLAGWSEFSLRFVSVAWSMAGLAFVFNLTKRLYNDSAGLWALALAVVAPALVVYAQEARMYATFFAFTAATLYFGWRVFECSNQQSAFSAQHSALSSQRSAISNRTLTWAFLLCEAGLLFAHYFAIPLVVALNLCAFIVLIRRRARMGSYARWIGEQVIAAAPIVIWTVIVFSTPGSLINPQEAPPSIISFLNQVIMLWLSGGRDLQSNGIALSWLAVLILPAMLIGAWLANRRNTLWTVMFAGVSLAAAYLMTQVLTSFHPRYVLPFSVPLLVMLGAALSNLSRPRLADGRRLTGRQRYIGAATASLLFVTLVISWAASSGTTAKDDARGVAAYLKEHATAESVILLEANDYTLNYYDHGLAQTKMITAANEIDALAQLSTAIGSAKRVWLPHWSVSTQDLRGYWPFLLELSGSLKNQTSFRGYDLAEYEMQSPVRAAELIPSPTNDALTHRSSLNGQGADGALAFALTWRTPEKFFDSARVSVRLSDARGNMLNARDAALLDEHGRTSDHWSAVEPVTDYYVLPIPPGTPPGTYTVTAQLYHARDVIADEVVGTIDLPRRLDASDPYHTLAGYDWRSPTNRQILPGLTLEAYAVGPPDPRQPLDVTLRWRKTGDASNDTPHLRLAQADRVWNEVGSSLLERDYPIDHWIEGETVIDRLKIGYPPMRGPLDLQIGQGDRWITLTTLQLNEPPTLFNPPSMQHTQSARFDDFAELLGYDLKTDSLSSSRPLNLTLYWRALNTEPITTPYTAFVQILAPDGHLVAQHDAPPDPLTTQWVPGQIVTDQHAIEIVDPAYRGPATLIVGWYNSATIERVPAHNGGDFVTLSVPVRIEDQ